MQKIIGDFNTAIVFAADVEGDAKKQIKTLCDQEFIKESKIRIMPDVHCGAGCAIGTTLTIEDKVVPNLVGVDIGCGMEVVKLKEKSIDFKKLDDIISTKIPSGFNIRKKEHFFSSRINLENLKVKKQVNLKRAKLSIGTLGGGNHFIEVNEDAQKNLYLVVHSGSRHIGNEVARIYQKKAANLLSKNSSIPKELAYLSGKQFEDYLNDMRIIQNFADLNRKAIVEEITNNMKLEIVEQFKTIHNYIDTNDMILRKGAVSAKKEEKFLVPLNMKDGSLICLGKGNPQWNFSAPHGAGRIMSRKKAKKTLNIKQYKQMMQGIYTTSVNRKTIDECPLAYKSSDVIVDNISPTAEIIERLKPVYNFKAPQ
ncbi:RtcB family protein [Proteinivorax tanatarense]|uniref:3'-phosphate/5'-hydroxy nucleic acid ligase n=1 Tax=Proteinivorax tanatarense TaxID=1260629 RepID=A0AAU7VJN5_9FIRM